MKQERRERGREKGRESGETPSLTRTGLPVRNP